ncbi:hypothetical protein BH09PSE1_BH09PSE1_05170 [soil metagenome]
MTDYRGSELQFDQGRDNWRCTGVAAQSIEDQAGSGERTFWTWIELLGAAMMATIATQALYRR